MALRGVCEVALHFGSFRNVDLFYQGIYQLRCRVFEETDAANAVNAVPCVFAPEAPARPAAAEVVKQAGVLTEEAVFRTKSVLIKYCEEQAELNDSVIFRFERDVGKDPPLLVEVGLYFTEAPSPQRVAAAAAFRAAAAAAASAGSDASGAASPTVGGGDDVAAQGSPQQGGACPSASASPSCGSPSRSGQRSPPDAGPGFLGDASFFLVSSQRVRLNNVMQGVHECCPLSFDEMHFCKVELMVHSTFVGYRLRIRPEAPLLQLQAMRHGPTCGATPIVLADGLVAVAGQLAKDALPEPEAPPSPSSGPAGIAGVETGADALSPGEAVDYIQRECVARLMASHADLARFLRDLTNESLPPFLLPGQHDAKAAGQLEDLMTISSRLSEEAHQPQGAALAVRLLTQDLNAASAQVLHAWQRVLGACMREPQVVAGVLQDDWNDRMVRFWAACVHRRTSLSTALAARLEQDLDPAAGDARRASERRRASCFRRLRPGHVEDLAAVPPQHEQPLVFEEHYRALEEEGEDGGDEDGSWGDPTAPPKHCANGPPLGEGSHVIVLVHGFQGTGFDMRLLKNNIALLHPAAICLCSISNEEDTEGNIEVMGERLAQEVRTFVLDWCTGESGEPDLSRLSFVTHSVGGLIARAALPLLTEFHGRMWTFMSFSSPHLGYLYSPTPMFKAGLWVAKKLRKSRCLEQLSMTDAPDPGSGFLSRLAELPGLEHFQHVVLVSSHQDNYAPFESARIEMPRVAEADPKLGPCYAKMLRNLLGPLKAERVIRMDVDFHIPETNIDAVIGRTAHIQFIESQALMKMIVQTHGFLFE